MFSWVDGVTLTRRLSAESMAAVGVLLAELHEHAASNTTEPSTVGTRADRVVYFHSENRVLTHESQHGRLLVEAIDRIQRLLDELWQSPPHRPHLLHGDFGPNNILSWRGRLRPIDFQDLQFGFDLQDLALTCADLNRNYPELLAPFNSGYASVRGWPELSPELESALAAARSLNLMNLGLHLRRPGIERYLDAHATRVANWMDSNH
jgi:Ser/Thr protein kinase RdoA (MazF antagonist)